MNKDPFHDEGYEDYYEGVDKSDNPYPEGSDGCSGWRAGWEAADEEGT